MEVGVDHDFSDSTYLNLMRFDTKVHVPSIVDLFQFVFARFSFSRITFRIYSNILQLVYFESLEFCIKKICCMKTGNNWYADASIALKWNGCDEGEN